MEHYHFSNHAADDYTFGFEPSLFNLKESLRLQRAEGWIHFYILNDKHKRIEGQIHFYLDKNVARSPLRNPFGSVEYSDELPPQVLFDFIDYFENELKNRGITHVVIKNYPEIYGGARSSLLSTFLINCGYIISGGEVAAVINTSKHNFRSTLSQWELRKLKQVSGLECSFEVLELSKAQSVFTFIEQCRRNKGYDLSMTYEQLSTTINTFKERFLLSAVVHNGSMIAASIAIKVRSDILYNFYMDHDAEFDRVSPAVKLIEGLYSYCAGNNITWLDLGTSALGGQPNFGLLNFKLNLGAEPSSKFTFSKVLK